MTRMRRWQFSVAVGSMLAVLLATLGISSPASAATLPGSPTNVSATGLEAAATVTWQAPASTGSGPLTGYVITATPGGSTLAVPGTSLTATMGGLSDGTTYTFTVAATNASGTGPTTSSNSVTPSHPGGQYHPLSPYRICDTRPTNPSGLSGTDAQCTAKTLGPGGSLAVQVAGTNPTGTSSGGVPSSGVTAVALNVTVTGTTAASYLTVWPTGSSRQTTSSLNWPSGDTVSNLVQVDLGSSGQVSVYNAEGSANVVVDVEGYVSPSDTSTDGLYHPLTPYRICDTRSANPSGLSGTDAQCQDKTLGPAGSLDVQVSGTNPSGTSSGGVPAGASAVVLNVTVTGTTAPSYLTVWPTGSSRQTTSSLNWSAGKTIPNRVVVALSASGKASFYNASGHTDLVVDVGGYYTSSGSAPGSYFSGVAPARICDTRSGNPSQLSGTAAQCNGKTLGPGGTLQVQVAGVGGVPAESSTTPPVAVVLNVTVTNTSTPSYLTVWPTGSPQPVTSDLNWPQGDTVPNLVQVALGTSGQVSIYNAQGSADVVADVVAYESGTSVVPPSTETLSPDSLSRMSSISADQSSLSFSSTNSQLSSLVPGDVIVAGPSTIARRTVSCAW